MCVFGCVCARACTRTVLLCMHVTYSILHCYAFQFLRQDLTLNLSIQKGWTDWPAGCEDPPICPLSSHQQAYKRIPLRQFFMWVEGIWTRVPMFVCAANALPTEPSRQSSDSFEAFIPHVRTCHNIKTLVGPRRVRGCGDCVHPSECLSSLKLWQLSPLLLGTSFCPY